MLQTKLWVATVRIREIQWYKLKIVASFPTDQLSIVTMPFCEMMELEPNNSKSTAFTIVNCLAETARVFI